MTDKTDTAAAESSDASEATLRVERGEPTPEELAALLAVIASRSGVSAAPTAQPKPSAWTDRSRYVRRQLSHFPDGWRASAFPR